MLCGDQTLKQNKKPQLQHTVKLNARQRSSFTKVQDQLHPLTHPHPLMDVWKTTWIKNTEKLNCPSIRGLFPSSVTTVILNTKGFEGWEIQIPKLMLASLSTEETWKWRKEVLSSGNKNLTLFFFSFVSDFCQKTKFFKRISSSRFVDRTQTHEVSLQWLKHEADAEHRWMQTHVCGCSCAGRGACVVPSLPRPPRLPGVCVCSGSSALGGSYIAFHRLEHRQRGDHVRSEPNEPLEPQTVKFENQAHCHRRKACLCLQWQAVPVSFSYLQHHRPAENTHTSPHRHTRMCTYRHTHIHIQTHRDTCRYIKFEQLPLSLSHALWRKWT